eukprot:364241-Chlamydomonas_euryale.AAC.14
MQQTATASMGALTNWHTHPDRHACTYVEQAPLDWVEHAEAVVVRGLEVAVNLPSERHWHAQNLPHVISCGSVRKVPARRRGGGVHMCWGQLAPRWVSMIG